LIPDMSAVIHHPSGVQLSIVGIKVVLAKLIAVAATTSHLTQCSAYERFKSSMISAEGIVLLAVCIQRCYFARSILDSHIFLFFLFLFSDAGAEETTIAAYWVTDWIDRCTVGFLPRHLVRRAHFYSGRLVQVVEMLADSENSCQRRYSRHYLGACKAVMIDALIGDNVQANGLFGCCMDAIARSLMQEEERKNDDENEEEFLSAQEEEGRIKDYRDDCTIHFKMFLVDSSLSCQCCPSQDCGALQVEAQFFPNFRLELIETLQQHVKFILAYMIWSVRQSIFPWKTVSTHQNSCTFVGTKIREIR
jgi:hypothetical protein